MNPCVIVRVLNGNNQWVDLVSATSQEVAVSFSHQINTNQFTIEFDQLIATSFRQWIGADCQVGFLIDSQLGWAHDRLANNCQIISVNGNVVTFQYLNVQTGSWH